MKNCTVVWWFDSHEFRSDEMNREQAKKLKDDLKSQFGIDATIQGCESE